MVPSMSTHLSFVTRGTPLLEVMVFVYPFRESKTIEMFLRSGSADCRERATDTASLHFSRALVPYVKTYYFQSSWFLTRPLGDVSHRQYLTLRNTARPHRFLSGPLSSDAENRLRGSRLLIQCCSEERQDPTDVVLGQVDDICCCSTTGAWS